jgi:hypothetical protein
MVLTTLNIDTRKEGGIRKIPRESTPGPILKAGRGNTDIKAAKADTRRTEGTPATRLKARRESTPGILVVIRNLRETTAAAATGARLESTPEMRVAGIRNLLSSRGETCAAAVGIRRKAFENPPTALASDIQWIREGVTHERVILRRAGPESMPAMTLAADIRNPLESTVAENTQSPEAGNNIQCRVLLEDTAALVGDIRRTQLMRAAVHIPRSAE